MKQNATILVTILTLTSFSLVNSQTVKQIADRIAKVNVIEDETIGFSSIQSENFKNFKALKTKATNSELVELLENKNSVVNAYAAFAMIDRSKNETPNIYDKFLNNDKIAETQKGCTGGQDKISSEIYHYYWNSIENSQREKDQTLITLDSLTLYNKNSDWLLILRALENRVYPKTYNKQIEYLAFQKTNRDAIFYLLNWYKAEYKEQLEKSLLNYLEQTNFEDVGVTPYYDTIDELFKFRNEDNNGRIVAKLKKDKFWKIYESQFISLLQKNGIYEDIN
jgi:hypothetical protein